METAQLVQQAETALRNNDNMEARSLLRQAVRQDPLNDQAWLLLARATPNARLAKEYINRAQSLQQDIPLTTPQRETRSNNKKTGDRLYMRWQYGLLALVVALLIAAAALSIAGLPRQQAVALQADEPARVAASVVEIPPAEPSVDSQPQTTVPGKPDRDTSQEVLAAAIIPTEAPPRTISKADTAGSISDETEETEETERAVTPEPAIGDGSDLALPAAIVSGLETEAVSASQAEQMASSEDPSQAETQADRESAGDLEEDLASEFAEDDPLAAEEPQDSQVLESETSAVVPYENTSSSAETDERWIDVNLTTQTLTAYEGDTAVLSSLVSSGMWQFPTVTGQFHTYMKLETQNMSGYHLGYNYFLENVPHVMYFYEDYALHGAYWHNDFGTPMSHGCVNMNLADAGWIFDWAPIGTLVNIHY